MSFRDYVQSQRVYFHPFATAGWPAVPPNFFAFRWANGVRQINRVVDYEVVASLTDRFPAVTADEAGGPHVVYQLGPDIPLPSGSVLADETFATLAFGFCWTSSSPSRPWSRQRPQVTSCAAERRRSITRRRWPEAIVWSHPTLLGDHPLQVQEPRLERVQRPAPVRSTTSNRPSCGARSVADPPGDQTLPGLPLHTVAGKASCDEGRISPRTSRLAFTTRHARSKQLG